MRHRMLLTWTLGFAGGIAAQGAGPGLAWLWLAVGIVGFMALLAAGRQWAWAAAGVLLAGVGAGGLRLAAYDAVAPTDVSHFAAQDAPVMLTGSVVSDPEQRRGGRVTFALRAQTVEQHGVTHAVTGDVSVTLTADALAHAMPPDYGDRVTLGGRLDIPADATNPGAFSWGDYLARRGIRCELRVKRPGAIQHLGGNALNPFLRLAWRIRRRILQNVHAGLPPLQAAVLSGILLGQRTELPTDLTADFVHTGTVHILASAGLHVGVVAWWALWLCERLTLPRKASAVLIVGTLWLYALMAGGRPSVVRAVVFATIYFGAILFEREPDAPTTLAAAGLVILLAQPTALLEAGFQLSFLTVMTLMLGMPLWQGWWRPRIEALSERPWPRKIAWGAVELAGLSLLAQIGAWPVVAADYNEVSLCGFAANALVVPVLFLLIPVGVAGAAFWGMTPAVGGLLLHGAGFGLTYIAAVVRWFSGEDWAYRALPTPSPLMLVVYYAAIFGLALWLSRINREQADSRPFLAGEGM